MNLFARKVNNYSLYASHAWYVPGVKGMFGLLRLDSLIVSPTEIDLPLYSCDLMRMFGAHVLILELYQTTFAPCALESVTAVGERFSDIASYDPGTHWYDDLKHPACVYRRGKKQDLARIHALIREHFAAYVESDAPACDPREKREKVSVYVENLLQNGGPSTDVFQKALGKEKTAELFRKHIFGTEA